MSAPSPGAVAGVSPRPLPASGLALLAALSLFWGLNWPFMKIALGAIPVWSFRSLCLWAGGCGLLLLAAALRRPMRLTRAELRPLVVCTLFNVVGWHLCSAYGVTLIPAGRAAIIAFTMPLWAALLAGPLLGERLTSFGLAGLTLGLAGLAVLIGPEMVGLGAAPLGALFMVGAAISWGIGTLLLKRHRWSVGPATLAGYQLAIGALPVTLGALILERDATYGPLTVEVLMSVAYILLLAMIFCHWAWFRLVGLFPAVVAALGTLAIPVVGVLSSSLLLGEPLGWRELAALLLIGAALALVLVVPALGGARATH